MELANPTELLEVRPSTQPVTYINSLLTRGCSQPSLPSRRIALPPELLSLALTSLIDSLPNDPDGWRSRNATLSSVCLVSKDWSEAAYHELYGDLRVEWVGRRRKAIVKAFEANPTLHCHARRLTVELTTFDVWRAVWMGSQEYDDLREIADARWPSRLRRTGVHEPKRSERTRTKPTSSLTRISTQKSR